MQKGKKKSFSIRLMSASDRLDRLLSNELLLLQEPIQ